MYQNKREPTNGDIKVFLKSKKGSKSNKMFRKIKMIVHICMYQGIRLFN